MFANARQYNQEGSWVVNDANELQKAFEAEFARQTQGTDLPGMSGGTVGGGGRDDGGWSGSVTPAPSRKVKKKAADWSDDEYGSD